MMRPWGWPNSGSVEDDARTVVGGAFAQAKANTAATSSKPDLREVGDRSPRAFFEIITSGEYHKGADRARNVSTLFASARRKQPVRNASGLAGRWSGRRRQAHFAAEDPS